ncbi:MAG: hypothetical protein NC187_08400 [Candidatus Amulumruptor caecigallinarius]|nr:hypothetical protein [Candidatus Amulumruptor caecigallinarius]MCM1397489.1 hypothetical protein [Candidatus Amulumruptor caecigallinarius]MCM1454391.1 hypothetical protein [bacterium]
MKPYTSTNLLRRGAMLALAAVMALAAAAQSPYSKFGYGLLRDNATSAQRQMGGVGYAMASGRQTNVMNPASYAAIDTLTFLFDMGLDFSAIKSTENGVKETNYGGGLDYVTLHFPVSHTVGMSFGLLPYSSVGYAFGSKIDNGSSARQGSGGLNLLYLGAGWAPFKGARVGMNFSYFFGTTYNDVYAYPSNSSMTSLFEQVMQVRDFHMDFGVQYGFEPAPRHRVTFGATFSPGKSLLGNMWVLQYDNAVTSAYATEAVADTVLHAKLKDHFSIPCTWGAGVNYEWNRRVVAEVDFTYQPWKDAKFAKLDDFIGTTFANRWRVGAGAEWTPDPRGSYFRRMNYRIGAYYNRDYITVNSNNVRDYGCSLGFGFPAVSGKSVINLGFEYRHRASAPQKLLTENYFNITLGINFNERWFMQSKLR